jgi:hypothetical protein
MGRNVGTNREIASLTRVDFGVRFPARGSIVFRTATKTTSIAMKLHQILIAAALPFAFASCGEKTTTEKVNATADEAAAKAKEAVAESKDAAGAAADKAADAAATAADAAADAVDATKDAAADAINNAADAAKEAADELKDGE